MTPPIKTESEWTVIENWIMAALVERRSCFASALAPDLGLTAQQIGSVCTRLKKRGLIYSRGRPRRWFVTSAAITRIDALKKNKVTESSVDHYITADDLAWMEYWRQPRAMRCQQPKPYNEY